MGITKSPNPLIALPNTVDNKDIHIMNTKISKSKQNLPVILLCNIQSFGKSNKTDKTAELDLVLKLNKVQVGVFTETWLDDTTCQHLDIDNYVMFHSARSKALKASGGVSVFVMDDIPSTKINVNVPDHLEVIFISIRPKWLPRSISNIVICAVYYPGSKSKYAPPQEDLKMHLNEQIHKFYSKYADPYVTHVI